MKEACGVFGVLAPGRSVAHLTFDGLYALQHRGQESAGMAVSDGENVMVMKDMGLVASVFDDRTLQGLPGDLAIGHTRYSTHGTSHWSNAQPLYRSAGAVGFAIAHNGNLTNTDDLSRAAGMLPGFGVSDSDVMAELLGQRLEAMGEAGTLEQALVEVMPMVRGAFSLVLLDQHRVYGLRDPNGFRPLCIGRLERDGELDGYVLASETPALDVIGATFEREVEPGEIVVLEDGGYRSLRFIEPEDTKPALCIFEFVYFARPDSQLRGQEVHTARRRMGKRLATVHPVEADMVMGVPDSGVPAAEGYAQAAGIPYGQGLVKNRYIGRTFITPDQNARATGVRRKLNPLRKNITGKRLVVVDDSIVRGTTTKQLVKMLREAGAAEVHLRISSPPFRWPCYYGIDTPTEGELLANARSIEEITEYLGADTVAYMTIEQLVDAIDAGPSGFCSACLTNDYPVEVSTFAVRRQAGEVDASPEVVDIPQPSLPGV